MMCLFKPNTYDPKDWQCPKPSCRTVNFKKRSTCISCGARKTEGSHRPLDDWRDGEKTNAAPWDCEACGAKNEAGSIYCLQCKNPSIEQMKLLEEEKQRRSQEEGRGGGLYDRQDPQDKKHWDSDGEEFDEFGRRKKKRAGGARTGTPRADPVRSSVGTTPAGSNGGGDGSRAAANTGGGDAGTDAASAGAKGGKAISAKHRAALERLRNKHSSSTGASRNGARDDRESARDARNGRNGGGRRSRSRSTSWRRR